MIGFQASASLLLQIVVTGAVSALGIKCVRLRLLEVDQGPRNMSARRAAAATILLVAIVFFACVNAVIIALYFLPGLSAIWLSFMLSQPDGGQALASEVNQHQRTAILGWTVALPLLLLTLPEITRHPIRIWRFEDPRHGQPEAR